MQHLQFIANNAMHLSCLERLCEELDSIIGYFPIRSDKVCEWWKITVVIRETHFSARMIIGNGTLRFIQ